MHYNRLELRLLPRGWSGGQLVEGVVPGAVRGVAVEVESGQVEYTLIQPKHGARAGDTALHQAGNARTQLPSGLARVTRQCRVRAGNQTIGWVSRVWCDRLSREVTHLLVQSRRALLVHAVERIVEVAYVASWSDGAITLKVSPADAANLPIYRTDGAIAADLRAAFEAAVPDPRTRRAIKVRVEDGHVHLGGIVDAAEPRERACAIARAVPGVRGVTSDVLVEEALGGQVETALARELGRPDYAGADVRTFTEHGIVYLEGRAPSAAARQALERVAVGVAGVRVVVNNLLVPGESPERARDTGPLTRNK
jgi:osmotically-inducible protein OsmY